MIRPKKFLTCRRIEKQTLHLDRSTDMTSRFLNFRSLPAADIHACSQIISIAPREHSKAGNGCDRRQCFATKPQSSDGRQITGSLYFTGRMTEDSQFRILHAHALAIIGNPHKTGAAGHNLHFDTSRTGVHCIFNQLLDHRCRPLYHLTGSNFIDGSII